MTIATANVSKVDELADEKAYEFRGPVLPVGLKIRERIMVNGVRTSDFLKPKAKPVTIKADIVKELENVYTVTGVAGGQVIEYSTEVVAGHTTTSLVGLDGRRQTTDKLDELIKQTITSKKIGLNWVHGIPDHATDETEKIALLRLAPWFADRDSFPRVRQQLGSSWAIDKAHIRKLVGGGFEAYPAT